MNTPAQIRPTSFRFFLVVQVAIPLITVLTGSAQTPPDPAGPAAPIAPAVIAGNAQTAAAERVIVTGSNIPTAEEVGPNPVLNYNRDIIEKSGDRTSEEFLRNLPIANATGVPVSNNENGSNTAVGAATIALRAFDARATLVLIDGRRVAPYPIGNNPGLFNTMFVDLNSIPQSAIESIEILKDGASTTYGADAVAGVVNIKLRKEYAGAEATFEYGNTLDKDSGLYAGSLIFGVGDGNTNVTGTMNFYHRNSIANRDRGFSANPPFLSSNSSPYNLQLSDAVVIAAGGTPATPASAFTFGHAPFLTDGAAPASAYTYSGGRTSHFNFNQFSLSFPEAERYGGYVNVDHKICGDQLVMYADFFYQNTQAHNELAAPATGSFQTFGQTILAIPPRVPIAPGAEPPNTPTHAETGLPANAFNPFNPFNQIISGGTRARLAEFGNRLFDDTTYSYLTTIGVRGDKLFDGNWGYDGAFRYSESDRTQRGTQVSAARFNRILNAADPIFDPASEQFIGTTVPFNPFGDYRRPIPSNEASVNFARIHPKDVDISKLATVDLNVYTTSLFKLPGGDVGLAFGGQFRRESLTEEPDQLNVIGDVAGNSPVPEASGGRKSYAFYAETRIPLFSPEMGITGLHSVEFTAAGRYEAFQNNDTNVLVPKFGVRWQPFDEQLTLRSTWGEGFREPSLEELYAAPISTLFPSHDPQNGGAFEPETNTLVRSNPNLQPEDSRSFSAGFVYTPKQLPGLTVAVDFWDIERTGVIFAKTADAVLQDEQNGTLTPGESVERDAAGNITRITTQNQNNSSQTARGVDFALQYQRQTEWGTFTSLTQVTYLYEFFFPQYAEAFGKSNGNPIYFNGNLAGVTSDPGMSNEGWYRWKGSSSLDWTWHNFDLVWTGHYIDGFRERMFGAQRHLHYVSQTWLFDVQASYSLIFAPPVEAKPVAGYSKDSKQVTTTKDGKAVESTAAYSMPCWKTLLNNSTFTIGCNNVFGQDPPFAAGEGGNSVGYPGFTYDATGRFVYVRLTKKF